MNSGNRHSDSDLRKSLNLIILAITFGMAFFSTIGSPLGAPPFTGFIRKLGAGDLVYGIIMAMPVVGGILQVFASYFMESTGKRRSVFIIFGLIHRLLWIPIGIIPLLFPLEQKTLMIWLIAVLITISTSANSITGVAFWSWMGALVPMEIRGRFFSRRTMISTLTTVTVGLGVGKFLDTFNSFTGFAIVFVTVAIIGTLDIVCFFKIKHPPMEVPKEKAPFFTLFLEPFRNKNYVRLILFVSTWMFGVNFAGPFFNVYMTEYLHMSYLSISLFTQVLSSFSTIFFIQFWGRMADRYGNKPISKICCTLGVILPFIWLFATPQNYMILLVMNTISGLCWPGLDMANLNMSVWLAPKKNRSIYVACYSLVTAVIGIALAYICGGAFMEFTRPRLETLRIPFVAGQSLSSFHLLFILSGLIRLAATHLILPTVEEENSQPASKVLSGALGSFRSRMAHLKIRI